MTSSIFKNVLSGLIVAVVSIASAFSSAALIFSGELSFGLGAGIKAAMLTAAVAALIVALTSGFDFAVAGPDSNATTVLAVMATALAHDLSRSMDPGAVLLHVIVAMATGTAVTGVVLYALGRARAGSAIRYIPYPLVGGFLAATGLFMSGGAVRVMTDVPLNVASLERLLAPEVLVRLVAGVAFTALLALALARVRHFLTLPAVILIGIAVVHVMLLLSGTSLGEAREQGWLFSVEADAALMLPWTADRLAVIEWRALAPAVGGLIGVMLVSSISILLNATGLEVAAGVDADLNRELRAQGYANLASAVGGGFIGYLSLSRSLLNRKAGASGRLAGVVVAAACAAVLVGGTGGVGFVPPLVLGGLLLYLGAGLLFEWGIRSRRHLSIVDYGMILAILAMTVYWGFINAIFIGLIAGCMIFAFNYSRVRFIKHELTGSEFRSAVERSKDEHHVLVKKGGQVRILVLQGYLFFGSAHRLYLRVKDELQRDPSNPPRFLVLDFRLVSGVDSSTIFSFLKIVNATVKSGARVLLTGLGPVVESELRNSGLFSRAPAPLVTFSDLDRAMEWCETEILGEEKGAATRRAALEEWLTAELGGEETARALMSYLERRELDAGATVCLQGEEAESIYFLERGRVSILLEREGQEPIRLRSMTGRTVIGEVGFYLGGDRSASVVTEAPSVVHELDREGFDRMRRDRPELSTNLNAMIVRVLAERLIFANGTIDALQR